MGDREENIELIKRVESERCVHELSQTIPLWGIWNSVKKEQGDEQEVKKKRVSFLS